MTEAVTPDKIGIMKDFPTRFDFNTEEPKIYQKWLESGGFSPDNSLPQPSPQRGEGDSRCILMPPINANGQMHIGHAYEVAIQDTLIRYWRMRGYKTLWQPGVDHAGFETQIVYEKKLEKEGRTRFGMDRKQLYDEIFAFSKSSMGEIRHQLERMGASADWSRFAFMLDDPLVQTVYKTFKQLYDDDLIYRAKRPVHWCIKHQTTLSDLEVKDEERTDALYYIKYGPIKVATTRPETLFGDVAIAVHPDDVRYQKYVGQTITVDWPWGTVKVPVIADDYVNREFGTGAVKITPAHDPNDFAIGERHNLPTKVIINELGKLVDVPANYAGLKLADARQKVVDDLQAIGLVDSIDENYHHSVKVCYKCGNVIEPRVIDQWWLALTKTSKSGKNLRDLAVAAIESNETEFVSEKYKHQFDSWMSSLRDWPLSRQIVWGIRIPAWTCQNNAESKSQISELSALCPIIVTNGETPQKCPTCGGADLVQDSDVFDTWFSSCQWPFSTLGNHGDDLKNFYPTTVMAPGFDIIFFWVARMMMLSIYTQGKSPYKTILLHGLVRDKDRQKMSKSKGNVVDPLGVAGEFGVDAVRLSLLYGAAPGTDPIIDEAKIRGMRNFTTKLWNIARYISMNIESTTKAEFIAVSDADHAVSKKLQATIKSVTESIDAFQLHLALESLYQFVWHDVADIYIEASKNQLTDEATKSTTQGNLLSVMMASLRLLHPFAPFTTEALWSSFGNEGCLMNSRWPNQNAS